MFCAYFFNIVLENFNVLILESNADLCLFFTNFVLVFYKMSRKRPLQGFRSMSKEKRSFFDKRSTESLFYSLIQCFSTLGHHTKVGRRRL